MELTKQEQSVLSHIKGMLHRASVRAECSPAMVTRAIRGDRASSPATERAINAIRIELSQLRRKLGAK